MKWKPRSIDCLFPLRTPCPQFSCLSWLPFSPGPCSVVPSWEAMFLSASLRESSGARAARLYLISLIIAGLMTLEAVWDGPFLDTSLLSGNSHLSEAGCRERWPPRPKNVPLADCSFFNGCPGNHKTSCPGRMETAEGRSVRLGIAGAPAIPRAPPRALRAPSRPLSHPPATAPEIDGRWQAEVGTAVGGGAKVAPFLAALLPPNHQFLEEGGCVSIFFSLWL